MHTLEQIRSGELTGIRRLKLCCGLTEFPQEIFSLADSLEILDLTGNQLSSLPEDLHRLTKLNVIFCSDNRFTHLPKALGQCQSLTMVGFKANQISDVSAESLPPKLRWLILTDNQVASLPDNLGECSQLQKLMLAGNQLSSLPESLAQCDRLELVRLAANKLQTLPDWLFKLPRLTWLAYAGNPCSASLESQAFKTAMPNIDWHLLELEELLGEGASGLIYKAKLKQSDASNGVVAVKLFKGAMTSDGLPLCEMASTMKAGQHNGLTSTLGKISNHPEGTEGLVMELIPESFNNLAGPPSLDSCTRDVYLPETSFSSQELLNIAETIADAVAHLHQQGVMHGDMYAHNILVTSQGEALLSDYGAASFFDPSDSAEAAKRVTLESRAFGCLLEELVQRCHDLPSDIESELNNLIIECLQADVTARPTLSEILARLRKLGA